MAFSLCNHLSSGIADCASSPPAGTPCACICKNAAGTAVRPRIRNLHDGTHGRLVKDTGTPPAGFLAVYDFQHDTTGTQSAPCVVDGDYVAWSGGTVKIRIRYQGPTGPAVIDLETGTPTSC